MELLPQRDSLRRLLYGNLIMVITCHLKDLYVLLLVFSTKLRILLDKGYTFRFLSSFATV